MRRSIAEGMEDVFNFRSTSGAILKKHILKQSGNVNGSSEASLVSGLGNKNLPVSQPWLTFLDPFLETDSRKAFLVFSSDVSIQGMGIVMATNLVLGGLDLYVVLKYSRQDLDFVLPFCGGIVVCCMAQLYAATHCKSFALQQGLISFFALLQGILNVIILGRSNSELFLARVTLILLWDAFVFLLSGLRWSYGAAVVILHFCYLVLVLYGPVQGSAMDVMLFTTSEQKKLLVYVSVCGAMFNAIAGYVLEYKVGSILTSPEQFLTWCLPIAARCPPRLPPALKVRAMFYSKKLVATQTKQMEHLLFSNLPYSVVMQLRQDPEKPISQHFDAVSIGFLQITG
jgi:hypothetical protein